MIFPRPIHSPERIEGPLFKSCLLVALVGALVVVLTACSMAPVKVTRRVPADDSWTARAAAARAEDERPRGAIEAWERKRPAEFNQPGAQ